MDEPPARERRAEDGADGGGGTGGQNGDARELHQAVALAAETAAETEEDPSERQHDTGPGAAGADRHRARPPVAFPQPFDVGDRHRARRPVQHQLAVTDGHVVTLDPLFGRPDAQLLPGGNGFQGRRALAVQWERRRRERQHQRGERGDDRMSAARLSHAGSTLRCRPTAVKPFRRSARPQGAGCSSTRRSTSSAPTASMYFRAHRSASSIESTSTTT